MTIAPPKLLDLAARLKSQIGPFFLGIVGDKNHTYGYHLGGLEVPSSDYSRQHRRDKDGIKNVGGYYAAAIDIGMGWKASREWLKWLVKECQAGKFPDVREVIGSFDGKTCFYYDNTDRTVYKRSAKDHITHSHIGFFRDAVKRDQTGVLADWRKDGRPKPPPPPPIVVPPVVVPELPPVVVPVPELPKPPVPESGQVDPEPPTRPVEPPESPVGPSEPPEVPAPPVEPSPAPSEPPKGCPSCPGAEPAGCLPAMAGAVGLAWLIKRRNELGAKDADS